MHLIDTNDSPVIDGVAKYLTSPFTYKVNLYPDYDVTVDDYDCYDDEVIKAYDDDQWGYTMLEAEVMLLGVRVGRALIGGVEYGSMPIDGKWTFIDPLNDPGMYEDVIAMAHDEAVSNLHALAKVAAQF